MFPLNETNLINLSKDGTFRSSGHISSKPSDVDALFNRLKQTQCDHLLLYFHGGLVSEASGRRTADALYSLFVERIRAHPLFFIWESGGLEVVKNNLASLADTPLFKELMRAVLKFALSKLESLGDGRGAGDAVDILPDTQVQTAVALEALGGNAINPALQERMSELSDDQQAQFERFLNNSLSFQRAADQVANAVGSELDGRSLGPAEQAGKADLEWFSPQALAELQAEVTPSEEGGRGLVTTTFLIKSAVGIFTRVVERIIRRMDHGLVCTVTEEILRQFYLDKIGGWIWSEMKQETVGAFASNDGITGELLHGGTYFLEKLNDYVSNPANPPLKVSLVGHSAGSIYICNLFAAAIKRLPARFNFHKIVLLAPAVDFELFRSTVAAHPDRFAEFRLYTMSDEQESKDVLVPLVYPRSLLYLVSGAFEGKTESPLIGLERFYSGKAPYSGQLYDTVSSFIKSSNPARVVWAQTIDGLPGLNCGAEHHGGFAEEPITQDSLAVFLSAA